MNKNGKNPRIIVVILLILACVFAITLYSIFSLHFADKSIISIYKDRVLPLQQLKNVSDAYTIGVAGSCFQYSLGLITSDKAIKDIKDAQLKGNSNWSDYLATYLTTEEKSRANQTTIIKASLDSIVEILTSSSGTKANSLKQGIHDKDFYNSLINEILLLNDNLDKLVAIQINEASNLKMLAENIFNKIIFLSIIVIIACSLILLISIQNHKLQKTIFLQTLELEVHKTQLEELVKERTSELHDSEAKFREIFNNATDSIILLKAGKILEYNPQTIEIFNCHDAYLSGAEFSLIASPRQTEEMLGGFDTKGLLDKALGGANINFDSVCIRPDGSTFEAEVSVSHLKIKNEILLQVILHDISERIRFETSLARSKSLLENILNSVPQSIFWKDLNSVYMGCNNKFALHLGINDTSLIKGKTDFDLPWLKEDAVAYRKDDREVSKTCKPKLHIIEQMQNIHGERLWLNTSKLPLLDNKDDVFAVLGIFEDITEKKKTEMELIESKLKLSAILESTTDLIWAVEPEQFGLINYNSAFANYFKYIIGIELKVGLRPSEMLFPENVDRWLESYRRVLKEGPFEAEYETHNKLKVLHISFNPILFEDKIIGISVFGRDITALKKSEIELKGSEERYRTISTLSGNMVYEHFIESDTFIAEGAITKVTGYSPAEFSCSSFSHWTEYIHSQDRQKVISDYTASIQNLRPFHSEYRILNREQEYTWIEHEAHILELNDRSGYKAMGMFKNINEKKMLANEILKSVIETEEKERLNFSQELHDGLGPLLSASKMYVQWLGKPDPKIEKQEIIKDIEKLLDESYMAVREISFKLSPHILKNYGFFEAIKAYVEKIEEKIPGKIHLSESQARRFNENIEIIAYRALCECINNGIKHSGASEINIYIACDETHIHVEYDDNGIGFDINTALASHKGIGLLNMQSRLNSINSTLNVNSGINKGTNIKFDINLAEPGFA